MIRAENLYKKYRKKVAVDDVSFEVTTGQVTGFLGPNGAGKSTAMRLMLGLDQGGGKTTFDGKMLHEYSHPSKVVGLLLEAKAFHPTRSARNHLKVLADAGEIPHARVDEVLDMVGLKEVARKKPGKFSLGMSQRLGIAAAILGKPKYLILDEPANGLDPEGIAWLRRFIKDYASAGNGVLVSSHLLSEMAQTADNIIVIGKGRLIANTSMSELVARNKHSGVFVRAKNQAKLEEALRSNNIAFRALDGGLAVSEATTDKIGELAFAAGATVLELSQRSASLEQAFLDLTADAEEFKAHSEAKK